MLGINDNLNVSYELQFKWLSMLVMNFNSNDKFKEKKLKLIWMLDMKYIWMVISMLYLNLIWMIDMNGFF
jgi:hypothetical protein